LLLTGIVRRGLWRPEILLPGSDGDGADENASHTKYCTYVYREISGLCMSCSPVRDSARSPHRVGRTSGRGRSGDGRSSGCSSRRFVCLALPGCLPQRLIVFRKMKSLCKSLGFMSSIRDVRPIVASKSRILGIC
jgi:hypothetical protein